MPIDYSRYPANWKSYIRPTVIERAGKCCETCGLVQGATVYAIKLNVREDGGRYKLRAIWFSRKEDALRETNRDVKDVKVVLTIAHLDHDETNEHVSLDRLKALCQICHLRYDAQEKYLRSLRKQKAPNQ